jgi:CelD/BcsL family acetyltransferase involved in cellulose biosynthesis
MGDLQPLAATLITTREGVERLAGPWEELRRRLEASPFVGPTLYLSWLDEFGTAERPFVVAVRDGEGTLRAVAPWVRRGRLAYSLPGHVKVAGELVVAPDDAEDAWRAILSTAFDDPQVVLVGVPHATDDLAGAQGALKATAALNLPARALPRFRRFRLELAGSTWEQYLATWSTNLRDALRKTRNRLARMGTVRFVEVDAADGYETLRRLHRTQWTEERTISWVHTEGGARIDRRLIAEVDSRILLLYLDDRAIAATLYFDTGARRVFLYQTRDPTIPRTSPGILLQAEKMRRSFADGVREVDMMGEGGRKERYGLVEHVGYELLIGRHGPVGRVALQMRLTQLGARRRASQLGRYARRSPRSLATARGARGAG